MNNILQVKNNLLEIKTLNKINNTLFMYFILHLFAPWNEYYDPDKFIRLDLL